MPKQILIVDDDTMMLQLLRLDCEQRSREIDIVTAEDGGTAIEIIEKSRPSVLVLDLRMPKVDGFAVLEHLKNQNSTMPVVILTNYNKPEYREKCTHFGVHDYIVKSEMKLSQLMSKLEEYAGV